MESTPKGFYIYVRAGSIIHLAFERSYEAAEERWREHMKTHVAFGEAETPVIVRVAA